MSFIDKKIVRAVSNRLPKVNLHLSYCCGISAWVQKKLFLQHSHGFYVLTHTYREEPKHKANAPADEWQ